MKAPLILRRIAHRKSKFAARTKSPPAETVSSSAALRPTTAPSRGSKSRSGNASGKPVGRIVGVRMSAFAEIATGFSSGQSTIRAWSLAGSAWSFAAGDHCRHCANGASKITHGTPANPSHQRLSPEAQSGPGTRSRSRSELPLKDEWLPSGFPRRRIPLRPTSCIERIRSVHPLHFRVVSPINCFTARERLRSPRNSSIRPPLPRADVRHRRRR